MDRNNDYTAVYLGIEPGDWFEFEKLYNCEWLYERNKKRREETTTIHFHLRSLLGFFIQKGDPR